MARQDSSQLSLQAPDLGFSRAHAPAQNQPGMSSSVSQIVRSASRSGYLLLAAVTVVAVVFRFYEIGRWSFWVEEHHSLRHALAIDSFTNALLSQRPLFYVLLRPILLAWGISETTARVLPALIGVVSVPIFFWIAKRLFGTPVALIVALLLAVSPWHIYWSQNARFYTLFLLLFNLALFAFYWGVETDRFRYIVISIAAMALAGATHPLAALLIPIVIGYAFLLKILPYAKPPGLRLRNILPFIALPLLGYIAYELVRVIHLGEQSMLSSTYLTFFEESTRSFPGYSGPYMMLTATIYYIGIPLVFLSMVGTAILWQERERVGLLLSLAAWGPLLTMMLLSYVASVANRYVFMSLPAWILLAAVAVIAIARQFTKHKWYLILWLVVLLPTLPKDPVIKDIWHHLQYEEFRLLLFVGTVAVALVSFLVFSAISSPNSQRKTTALAGGLLVLLAGHALIADSLYFVYQNGHRGDWKSVAQSIPQTENTNAVVAAGILQEAGYYIEGEVIPARGAELERAFEAGKDVWFVEDYSVEQQADRQVTSWIVANCSLSGSWDTYTAGRYWPMRVYHCTPGN